VVHLTLPPLSNESSSRLKFFVYNIVVIILNKLENINFENSVEKTSLYCGTFNITPTFEWIFNAQIFSSIKLS
jgi:hypothetical protein